MIGRKLERLGHNPNDTIYVVKHQIFESNPKIPKEEELIPKPKTETEWKSIKKIDAVRLIHDTTLDFLIQGKTDEDKAFLNLIKDGGPPVSRLDENKTFFEKFMEPDLIARTLDQNRFFIEEIIKFTAEKVPELEKAFAKKITAIGLNLQQNGKFGYIQVDSDPNSHFSGHAGTKGELAIFFETKKQGITRRYLIDVHTKDYIREMPMTNDAFQAWMHEKGASIAFKKNKEFSEKTIFSLKYFHNEPASLRWGFDVHIATPHIYNLVKTIVEVTSNPSLFVQIATLFAGLLVPGWDAIMATISGDTNQAFIYLGLEFVPVAGKLGKIFFKATPLAAKLTGKAVDQLEILEEMGSDIFSKGKDVYGARGTIEVVGDDVTE